MTLRTIVVHDGSALRHRSAAQLVCCTATILCLAVACAARGPVIGRDAPPAGTGGTISGIVRSLGDNTPLSARKVTAVNVETGQKVEASTATNGGYTIKVATGRYRLEVELRDGETVSTGPDEVHIGSSDLDASRNFVIASRLRQ
jgi:hypothetical protein